MAHTIMVVDDDPAQIELIKHIVEAKFGYRTVTAQGGRAAIERFMLRLNPQPDLVLIDLMMPDVNGVEVIRSIRRIHKDLPIIALSSQAGSPLSLAATRAGADDVLLRPANIEQLKRSIQNLLQRMVLGAEVERLSRYHQARVSMVDVKGKSLAIEEAITLAKRASGSYSPLLLVGEEGCGKELLARAIHGAGSRSGEPFVVRNCAMLAEQPDADSQLVQAFADADGGTLLLKQVDALTPKLQCLLLCHVQEQAMQRVGFVHQPPAARIISTSGSDLKDEMRQSVFHEDLYGLLANFPIVLPALVDRKEDIADLCHHFIARYAAQDGRVVRGISHEAHQLFMHHEWSGNVAELAHILQRAVAQCDDLMIKPEHVIELLVEHGMELMSGEADGVLQSCTNGRTSVLSLLYQDGNVRTMDDLEAAAIRHAIRRYKGKMTEVARRLGTGRSTLYRKIQDYNLSEAA